MSSVVNKEAVLQRGMQERELNGFRGLRVQGTRGL